MVWDLADSTTSLLSGGTGGSAGSKEAPELSGGWEGLCVPRPQQPASLRAAPRLGRPATLPPMRHPPYAMCCAPAPPNARPRRPLRAARSRFQGHQRPVEEVVFRPGSTQELASVGDDAQLLFWDARTGAAPVRRMADAHGPKDIQCVDWSPLAEHCVATGEGGRAGGRARVRAGRAHAWCAGAGWPTQAPRQDAGRSLRHSPLHPPPAGAQDGSIKVWDTRAMRGPDHTIVSLRSHTDAIIRLEWHPQAKVSTPRRGRRRPTACAALRQCTQRVPGTVQGILASGGDDRVMMVWSIECDAEPRHQPLPPEPTKKKGKGAAAGAC